MSRRGERKPGRKEAAKRLASWFPSKRKRRMPLVKANYRQRVPHSPKAPQP